jgi:hypothetical protein
MDDTAAKEKLTQQAEERRKRREVVRARYTKTAWEQGHLTHAILKTKRRDPKSFNGSSVSNARPAKRSQTNGDQGRSFT